MTKLRVTRDLGISYTWVFKLICDCGWYDRFYEKECLGKAEAHLIRKHGGGTIFYRNMEIEVAPQETS